MNRSDQLVGLLSRPGDSRRRVKTVVLTVLTVHAGFLVVLLMQGCRQEPAASNNEGYETNVPAVAQMATQPAVETAVPSAMPTRPLSESIATPAAAPQPVATEYILASGDSFGVLAERFHTSWRAFADANPSIDPRHLRVGCKIHLPSGVVPTVNKPAEPVLVRVPEIEHVYTVRHGDLLCKIASQFGTTPAAIREVNGLKSDRISIGQKLKIVVTNSARARSSAAALSTRMTQMSPTHGPSLNGV